MSEPAFVSVLVPCRDLGEYLDEAVDTVFAQTRSSFEILVVDDGSTEPRTLRLLEGYRWPKVRVLRQERKGSAAAKNLALGEACGRFCCALDPRHGLDRLYFEQAVDALEREPELAFVTARGRFFGELEAEPGWSRLDLPVVLASGFLHGSAVLRTEDLRAAGGYDASLPDGLEDRDLLIRLLAAGQKGRLLDATLVFLRGESAREAGPGGERSPLQAPLIAKHAGLYQSLLTEILLAREEETDTVVRRPAALAPVPSPLTPEAATAASLSGEALRRIESLEEALVRAHRDLDAYRRSFSWRVAGPLRVVHRSWRRLAGRLRPDR
jgi:GT2 family glycosyltransferase